MSRRPTAWMIFFGFLALVTMAGALGIGSRVVQYGVWGFWLVSSAIFMWVYMHTETPADRSGLIDTRGINLLPRAVRRWLFDESEEPRL